MDDVAIGLEVTGLMNSKPSGIGIYIKNLLKSLTKINDNVKLFYKITRIRKLNNIKKYSNNNLYWHYKNIYNPFNNKIDIVHVTDNTLLNFRGVPKIYTRCDTPFDQGILQQHFMELGFKNPYIKSSKPRPLDRKWDCAQHVGITPKRLTLDCPKFGPG